jgi:hypothetical protein
VEETTTSQTEDADGNTLRPSRKKGAQPESGCGTQAAKEIPKEFIHCMKELLQTEKDFANRMEALCLHYEEPVRLDVLLPVEAQRVIFGNGSAAKLVAASRACADAWEATTDIADQIVIFWDYLDGARDLYNDQIQSRALGQAPLQGFLQSNRKFRKFAAGKVPEVEKWFLAKGIQSHGHLGSVLVPPVQRLPRVLLLVMRMKEIWGEAPGLAELLALLSSMLEDFEQRNRTHGASRPRTSLAPPPSAVSHSSAAAPPTRARRMSISNACPICRAGFTTANELVVHAASMSCKKRSAGE